MLRKAKILILSALVCFISTSGKAQTCCSGGVPLSSNLGMPPGSKGLWQFNVSYDQNVLKTLKNGTDELVDPSRERITRSVLTEIGYGISDRISLDLFFPIVNQERSIRQFGNIDRVSTAGIGDMALLIKYQLTDPGNTGQNMIIGLGPKAPTGQTNIRRDDGILLNADLQPGSGAWDALMYAFYNHTFGFRPSMGISGLMVYSLKGVNPDYLNGQSYQFGNEIMAQVSVVDKINVGTNIFDLSVSLRLRDQDVDKFNDEVLPNTGGRFLFFTPGISYYILPSLSINMAGDIPVYAEVTGTQLAPSYRFNIGAYLSISHQNKIENINF